jgi:hypothetical protein
MRNDKWTGDNSAESNEAAGVTGGFSFGPASARRSDEHGGDDEHLDGKGKEPHRRALDDTHGRFLLLSREPFRPRNARLETPTAISTAKIDNLSA